MLGVLVGVDRYTLDDRFNDKAEFVGTDFPTHLPTKGLRSKYRILLYRFR